MRISFPGYTAVPPASCTAPPSGTPTCAVFTTTFTHAESKELGLCWITTSFLSRPPALLWHWGPTPPPQGRSGTPPDLLLVTQKTTVPITTCIVPFSFLSSSRRPHPYLGAGILHVYDFNRSRSWFSEREREREKPQHKSFPLCDSISPVVLGLEPGLAKEGPYPANHLSYPAIPFLPQLPHFDLFPSPKHLFPANLLFLGGLQKTLAAAVG